MKLGFLTSPLPEMTLEEIVSWASQKGFQMLEVACWPSYFEKRRYAGTQHIDVSNLTQSQAKEIQELFRENNLEISSLAYYPNPLDPDPEIREISINHLKKVIATAPLVGTNIVSTFIGRDKNKNLEESFSDFQNIFPNLVKFAEDHGVKLAIENCPMLFADRWPGGSNLAASPAIWDRLFELIPSPTFGLNLDPSHLFWQSIDYIRVVYDYKDRIFHVHAKDVVINHERLYKTGIYGFDFYEYRLAGLGDIDWRRFLTALYQVGYNYVVSIEHEDRAFEKDQQSILNGIYLSKKLLEQYII